MHLWKVWVDNQVGYKFIVTKYKEIRDVVDGMEANEYSAESIEYVRRVLTEEGGTPK